MSTASPLQIQIVSDVVCPWCYIGKRRLDRALAERPGLDVEVTWLPFQLSPDMPREGRDRREHYASIFGEERAEAILAGMKERGAADGIGFQLTPGAKSPNTLSAHVLMYWASQEAGIDQNLLAEKLFHAHHVDCEDIGDITVLARLAGEVGMDGTAVKAKLEARTDEDRVLDLVRQAAAAGVSGVPFMIFDRQHAVSGAQPTEVIVDLLDRLSASQPASH